MPAQDDPLKHPIVQIFGGVALLFLGGYVLAWVLVFTVYAAIFVATVGLGFFGFVAIKLKVPLVNPNGPLIVPIIYSALRVFW